MGRVVEVTPRQLVFKKFIDLAEQKVTEAQAKADEVQSSLDSATTTSNVEDLEASETPESILLSTVSGEQAKDRTDRAIVTPWLKFLWETYRTVLDIFKNNARLEVMYQTTAHQAFQFCSKYARKTEFRRLCELLRNHLQNAAKFSSQMHAINLSDPDTLQRHLDTRFQQLNVAVELELWQEAFRSVEDIHTLLSLSKRPAKNVMMANYFEKLTRIFLVSENYLFHAAAWSRYFNLLRQSAVAVASGQSPKKDNPAVTEADMTKAASFVILSALAIPVISTSRSRGALVDVDEARKNKNVRLTNLLGMSQAPTRAILFKDALSKGLLRRARPEIRDLYNILEVDFHPLSICKRISPILTQLGDDPEMQKYVLPLQQVILTRLFQQLSQVYDSVQIDFVLNLAQFPEPFQVSRSTIEKFILNGCKKGDLAIRVDHASGVLTFDSDVFSAAKALHPGSSAGSAESESSAVQRLQSTPAEIVRSQLVRLAKALFTTCQYVDPSFIEELQSNKSAALARSQAGAEKEHQDALARRDIIERQKQAASTALAEKEKEEARRKRIRAQQAQEAETLRLAEEQREREKKRIQAEQDRVRREEIEKQLKELKQGIKDLDLPTDLTELDSARIRAMKLAALEKEKNALGEQLRITWKRFDHLERAYRKEEIKHLGADYEKQMEEDRRSYEETKETELREAEEKHTEDVALKHRLSRLVGPYQTFINSVKEQRKAQFDKQKKAAEREFEQKKQQRIKEVRERRAKEKREAELQAQQEREEEERIQMEAEEKQRVEDERRQKMAEEKARREDERRRLDEQAAKQRAKEAEVEAKLAARRTGARPSAPAPAAEERPTSSNGPPSEGPRSVPPRIALAGTDSKPSWREREAARAGSGRAEISPAAPPADAPGPEPSAEPPRRTGYVPPALRQRDGASPSPGGGWRAREGSNRRDESPAGPPPGGPSKYAPPARRGEGGAVQGERGRVGFGERDERDRSERGGFGDRGDRDRGERAGGDRERGDRAESGGSRPGFGDAKPESGKYRPGAFRQRNQ